MMSGMIGPSMIGRWLAVMALGLLLAFAASAAEPVAGEQASADLAAGNNISPEWWAVQMSASGFKPAKRGQEWWRAVVAENPACFALSDGCQTCFAGADSFTCSNPGFACVANEQWACAGNNP